ncbi:alanine/glycine:cation symporter family protein [Clostridium cadaveris]|uniref:Alanine or glycine:cation symporter, AGCS family n=1 Tax=Clostridium cadaveris TaxID=1529 RepID=A0A1I2PXK4_9CLOT|nr:sodium:alanine symporter family protein [Clostridium cadaveris]MDM8313442.1 sodium:alanine symporter family protein [Clostridium cadaveris]MDY4950470.1 sodium:alanine symporter family protein [Clostridium cadaveris]NME66084.1 sodium:alanine symporter family protein [Clostridium cadaveris]SFG18747.1 alanine or glycine:cation symporter, AGCS family [Clostridium cadaveris]
MYEAFAKLTSFLWGVPLLSIILITGLYITIKTRGFQFRYLGHIMKRVFKKEKDSESNLTPFQAVTVAIGGTVGVSNMSGVATAIVTGGPGALFWLWIAAFLGMMIKMAEVTLAVYYRETKTDGTFKGGPTYYIQKALGEEKGMKSWKPLAIMFGFGIMMIYFITIQNFTISEAIGSTFNLNYMIPSAVIMICAYAVIMGGLKKIGKIASYIVPVMCVFYVGCVLYILGSNISEIPHVLGLVFKGAFTTQAAAGGFLGATVAQAMRYGFSRSVFSNEAGWGTSPMIHATAETDHPIKQGILGAFEVFMDTIVICSMTAFVIIITGYYTSGLTGATLTLSAFESVMGRNARVLLALSIFLFGLTTITGWYTYFEVIMDHAISDSNKFKSIIMKLLKLLYPIPGFLVVVVTVIYGGTPAEIWTFGDFTSVIPTFINVFALLLMSKKFFELLKDYKARYLGIGKVDANFKLFYEDVVKENGEKVASE